MIFEVFKELINIWQCMYIELILLEISIPFILPSSLHKIGFLV